MLHSVENFIKWSDDGHDWRNEVCSVESEIHAKSNTQHYQTFDPKIAWIENFACSKFSQHTISIIKQMPGKVIPLHVDQYHYFKKHYNISDASKIIRINIFLEDWKKGHYFEMGGVPIVNWKAGQYVILNNSIEHMSSNMGREVKYTAQITGVE